MIAVWLPADKIYCRFRVNNRRLAAGYHTCLTSLDANLAVDVPSWKNMQTHTKR
jgi:hypothetical protein